MSNKYKKKPTSDFEATLKTLLSLFNRRKQTKKRIQHLTMNVVVLGSKKVGKTCLIKALCGSEFERQYTPTVLDVYQKESMLGSSCVKFEFVDLADSYSFPAMTRLYIKKADVYLLVYDGTPESYETLTRLKSEIEHYSTA